MTTKRTKLILAALLLFAAGGACGAAGMGLYIHARLHRALAKGPWAFKEMALGRLTKKLNLDAAQHDKMDELLTKVQQQLVEVHSSQIPQIRQIIENAVTEGDGFLQPEQRKKLDAFAERIQTRLSAREKYTPEPKQ
jgi:Spy/CpxP family protein refolding chaperone